MAANIARGVALLTLLALVVLFCRESATAVGVAPLFGASAHKPSLPTSAGDWPMYGHDISRTNFNPAETAINASNVSQLAPRWQAFIGSGAYPTSSGPSVANGRVYVGSSVATGNNFFAFDALTGDPAWSANLGHVNDCSVVGIGSTSAISGTV